MLNPYTQDEEVLLLIAKSIEEHCPQMVPAMRYKMTQSVRGDLALMQLAFLAGLKEGKRTAERAMPTFTTA